MEFFGGYINWEEVTLCALPNGRVMCMEKVDEASGNFRIVERSDAVVLYSEQSAYIARHVNQTMSDVTLKKDVRSKICDSSTPLMSGKPLKIALFGSIRAVEFPTISQSTVITIHDNYVVFHSSECGEKPFAVIHSPNRIAEVKYGWDEWASDPILQNGWHPTMLNFLQDKFFTVALTCTVNAAGFAQSSAQKFVASFIPPFGKIRLPAAVVQHLSLLFDLWQNDKTGGFQKLFDNDILIKSFTVLSRTQVDIQGEARRHITPRPLTVAEVTPAKVPTTHTANTQADLENYLAQIKERNQRVKDAKLRATRLIHEGTLTAARQLILDQSMSKNEQELKFAQTLKEISDRVLEPLEECSEYLLGDMQNSYDAVLPGPTASMRSYIKSTLDDLVRTAEDLRSRSDEIHEAVERIMSNQKTLDSKYQNAIERLEGVLKEESHNALRRALSELIHEDAGSQKFYPNANRLLAILKVPNLFEVAKGIMPLEVAVEQKDSQQDTWLDILKTCEDIEKIKRATSNV